jgi:hypothetical protein
MNQSSYLASQDRRQAATLGGGTAYRGSDGGGGEPLAEGSSGGCRDGPCLAGVRVLPTVDLTVADATAGNRPFSKQHASAGPPRPLHEIVGRGEENFLLFALPLVPEVELLSHTHGA